MFSIEGISSTGKAQLLTDDQLRAAVTSKGTIAVVKVSETVSHGDERVAITASVEHGIFGRALHLQMTRAGRYPGVSRGQRYVVAVSGSGELLGYVPVGDLERTIEAHRRAVERFAR
jgi:hypothetical protein